METPGEEVEEKEKTEEVVEGNEPKTDDEVQTETTNTETVTEVEKPKVEEPNALVEGEEAPKKEEPKTEVETLSITKHSLTRFWPHSKRMVRCFR